MTHTDSAAMTVEEAARKHAATQDVLEEASANERSLPEMIAALLDAPPPLGFKGHSELTVFEHAYGDAETAAEAYASPHKACNAAVLAFCRARLKRIEAGSAVLAQDRALYERFVPSPRK